MQFVPHTLSEQAKLKARESYASHGWALMPSLISPAAARQLAQEALSGAARRVSVGGLDHMWTAHATDDTANLQAVLTYSAFIELALSLSGTTRLTDVQTWTHSYVSGEFIPWHKDVAGTIQMLICLEPSPYGCGGEFGIRGGPSIRLEAGDGVFFAATRLEHSTTPILCSDEHPMPRRVVAVSRFYCE